MFYSEMMSIEIPLMNYTRTQTRIHKFHGGEGEIRTIQRNATRIKHPNIENSVSTTECKYQWTVRVYIMLETHKSSEESANKGLKRGRNTNIIEKKKKQRDWKWRNTWKNCRLDGNWMSIAIEQSDWLKFHVEVCLKLARGCLLFAPTNQWYRYPNLKDTIL